MSKITLNNVGSLLDATTAATTINDNSAVIVAAMDNTLSRDGTSPNQMGADLDMNSHNILNANSVTTKELTLNGVKVESTDLASLDPVADGDIFSNVSGSSAIPTGNTLTQILDHSVGNAQGSLITRNASGWVELAPGNSGQFLKTNGASANPAWTDIPGGGDMLRANNLSDVLSADTSLTNLGGTTVGKSVFKATDAAAARTALGVTAGLTQVADRTALKALDTTQVTVAYLNEAGREGLFVFKSGDYSSMITLDTQEGVYIKATAIASTSGAWVRQGDWVATGVLVSWFGAQIVDYTYVGSLDNTSAVQAAINFANSTTKRVRFNLGMCMCASTIDLSNTNGLLIEGASGGPTAGAVSGSLLRFTGATGDGIKCTDSTGLTIRDLYIQNNNASYSGRLINAESSATGATALFSLERCTLGLSSYAGGAHILNLNKVISSQFTTCNFYGGQYNVIGGATGSFSNVIAFRSCQFINYGTSAVSSNAGQEWTFDACTFEQSHTGGASAINGTNMFGLTVSGCYFGDATAAGYWINLATAVGFVCTCCEFSGYSNAAATIGINFTTNSSCFTIEGNRFYSSNIGVAGTSGCDYGIVKANIFSGCVTAVSLAGATHVETTVNLVTA